ncbi:MAG TPA: cupin domain-containing protein [Casimicrobiaceae bacterium]|jgi:mannose-6-phosphate isomerase-like protein (cupin superfamily)|nr:cupin domain-containing protein [Casimicrobiaceae bacterium]
MSDSPVRRFVAADEGFRWAEVELRRYKEEGAAFFRDVTRQTLFRRPDLRGELRYFEVAAAGHSSLERHGHVHAVMILRGSGDVLIGHDVHPVRAFDLVTVPPSTWHQFRASPEAPLGFLCMVDAERDRPELPDARAIEGLRESPAAAAFLDATSRR